MSITKVEPMTLTIEQFAELYQLNPNTVRTNVSRLSHTLPRVTRFGRSVRFLKSDIDIWLKQQ